jgi:hypothetical protein
VNKKSTIKEPQRMDNLCTCLIEIQGKMDETDLKACSPLSITTVRLEADSTLLTVQTDQSGLIGLLRHLHGRGSVLLSVRYEQNK